MGGVVDPRVTSASRRRLIWPTSPSQRERNDVACDVASALRRCEYKKTAPVEDPSSRISEERPDADCRSSTRPADVDRRLWVWLRSTGGQVGDGVSPGLRGSSLALLAPQAAELGASLSSDQAAKARSAFVRIRQRRVPRSFGSGSGAGCVAFFRIRQRRVPRSFGSGSGGRGSHLRERGGSRSR